MNDYVEITRQYLNKELDIDTETENEVLNEFVSLRLGAVAVGLGKVKQYANKTDTEVRKLKSITNRLRTAKEPEDTNKVMSECFETIADLFFLQRKMNMYVALISASTIVGVDKSTKLIQKMNRRR